MKAKQAYAEWLTVSVHLPTPIRCGIGAKIENCFLELIECIFLAWYASGERKILLVTQASERLDILKLFLTTAWENKILSTGFYSSLIEKLYEVGRMSYRWRRSCEEKLPHRIAGENK
ncbi:MAG: hypothetical protein A3C08_02415 [Candidatus Taylorbacteria bacterium RIFCSPHIGHO2_02_FULL_47_18]|uniref:Four helix bundle protein n=1 Tax=Candidatus Taylorbacteria bacterium RIFCSPLOWO2_01_FULL_48_100 TaxID=1802322 RepID=A0A1G2NG12_9BACT|nr:MAG: hypothetical protein A3C08_02415 [Candidatus Taylorbacteria bacterium RIFCSPHIGHO2_02_FULL_47_18]OHA35006.1 MAG: hypothetical protein A2938_01400 [Candidatus Taylorbacteria bacterium RIFCSPLOWO2_01_FULL_48_100]OHA40959.1 MAG: hypothetical protein A3J31_00115 [Candidatus Taylorbacteria bacterium RIFCSPLOWO2_02_FULL_48_16]OHA44704.1 MAG: hypothetical protein A3H13_03145 [Candidatus Taylorbacteria bacterium RIFCSPLOWO2_12_FULL_48_11]